MFGFHVPFNSQSYVKKGSLLLVPSDVNDKPEYHFSFHSGRNDKVHKDSYEQVIENVIMLDFLQVETLSKQ